jgi:hypothetical protein
MTRSLVCVLTVSAVLGSISVAGATGPGDKFGHGKAWHNDGGLHYTNTHNPDLRMDWATGRRAIPGGAAAKQAANPTTKDTDNNVISRPASSLVDPHRTLPESQKP